MPSDTTRAPVLPPLLRVGDRPLSELDRLEFDYQLADMVWSHACESTAPPLPKCVDTASWSPRRSSADCVLGHHGPSGSVRVLVGDTRGRGLAAALASHPLKQAFPDIAAEAPDAVDFVQSINAVVRRSVPRGFFCAAGILDIDLASGAFSLWNCGLPTVRMVSAQRVEARFESVHPPLGVLNEMEFPQVVQRGILGQGSKLVLHTDGVLKARASKGVAFGPSAVEATLLQERDTPLNSATVLNAVLEFCWPRLPEDDVTIVVMG